MTLTQRILCINEDELNEHIASVPMLGRLGNLIQTVRERDDVRIQMKRVVCLVDAHRAHHIDLRFGTHEDRVCFSAMEPYVDAFLYGYISCARLLRIARRMCEPPCPIQEHLVRRVAYSPALWSFDTAFMRRISRLALISSSSSCTHGDAVQQVSDHDHRHKRQKTLSG